MPLSKARNRRRMKELRLHSKNEQGFVQPNTPLYSPSKHRAGDRVRILKGTKMVDIVIPELDADGNPIPVY